VAILANSNGLIHDFWRAHGKLGEVLTCLFAAIPLREALGQCDPWGGWAIAFVELTPRALAPRISQWSFGSESKHLSTVRNDLADR